jgi:hypothetical protein
LLRHHRILAKIYITDPPTEDGLEVKSIKSGGKKIIISDQKIHSDLPSQIELSFNIETIRLIETTSYFSLLHHAAKFKGMNLTTMGAVLSLSQIKTKLSDSKRDMNQYINQKCSNASSFKVGAKVCVFNKVIQPHNAS